jgi:hypothetical protein
MGCGFRDLNCLASTNSFNKTMAANTSSAATRFPNFCLKGIS